MSEILWLAVIIAVLFVVRRLILARRPKKAKSLDEPKVEYIAGREIEETQTANNRVGELFSDSKDEIGA